jgi:hypothetical protein
VGHQALVHTVQQVAEALEKKDRALVLAVVVLVLVVILICRQQMVT